MIAIICSNNNNNNNNNNNRNNNTKVSGLNHSGFVWTVGFVWTSLFGFRDSISALAWSSVTDCLRKMHLGMVIIMIILPVRR